MKKLITYFLIITTTAFISGCAETADPSLAYKGESPQQIFIAGKNALKDHSYSEGVKRFEALDVQYPYGENIEQAQLFLIYAYYKKGDYVLAASACDRFIRLHPTNPNIDYAFYIRGLSDYYQNMGVFERYFAIDLSKRDLTQIKKAYVDFNELTTRFPNSRLAPSAHQYLIYLRNILANHELEVAQFYFNHKAYVAAANRASIVVTRYEGAPFVKDALIIMIQSYRALGLSKLEQDTIRVLRYNYPTAIL